MFVMLVCFYSQAHVMQSDTALSVELPDDDNLVKHLSK